MRISHNPSVFEEPHLKGGDWRPDPSEARAAVASAETRERLLEQSVWDEPGLSRECCGPTPAGELTYADWLTARTAETSTGFTWAMTFLIALAAGPWAIVGVLINGILGVGVGGVGMGSVMLVCILGPLTEELMKIAVPLHAIEKHPYWFRSPSQLLLCALAGGVAFGVLENFIYLWIYIPDASPGLSQWRWSVCVALHATSSLVAGLGLVRVHLQTREELTRPRLELAYPFILAAVILHGSYNFLAIWLSIAHPF